MSNSLILSWDIATSRTYVGMGIPLIVFGVFGGIFNIIVFLSLRIYRENSSAFYLTVVSIVNTGQLLTGMVSRVLVNTIGVDWTESSLIFCKLRYFLFQLCSVISPTCLCLATIDQFLATSTRPQWQQRSNIKIAYRLTIICIIFWLLYGIPYLIYYTPTLSTITGQISCLISNIIYRQYYTDIHAQVFMCGIPLIITTIFGFLASSNVRRLAYQRVPIVRRRHEVQMTIMVLVQVVFNAFATTPSFIVRLIASKSSSASDPIFAARMRFSVALTTCIYYLYYTIPFYIYIIVSERFRKQFRYVIIDIYLNRQRRIQINQISPQIQLSISNQTQQLTVETIELI